VRGVDAGAIARGLADKARIPAEVHEARVAAVKALGSPGHETILDNFCRRR
jgi:tRNA nucleotidyltransferase (CCA-adding enzyme)